MTVFCPHCGKQLEGAPATAALANNYAMTVLPMMPMSNAAAANHLPIPQMGNFGGCQSEDKP